MRASRDNVSLVSIATLISWLGFAIHNVADLPAQTLLSPETSLPTLITVVLFLAWWRLPRASLPAWLLLGWGLLNLIGGAILSVIPLPFLPFYPEQSLRHYLFHLLYGLTQLPLAALMLGQTWHARRGATS